MPRALSVRTSVHGRVLVEDAAAPDPAGLLLGFHGYGQGGEEFLQDVLKIPGASRWRVAAVQALHRFYARDERVVASWMTRQDRDEAIADNIAYVNAAVDALVDDGAPAAARIVCLGFSQGASMAYRAALAGPRRASGVIALAGDIPPELKSSPSSSWPRVLIGVGDRETWYVGRKLDDDLAFLTERGVDHQIVRFAGGHEWTAEFRDAAARWLESVASTHAGSDPMASRSR